MRKSFKTADFVTYLQDIFFWIFTGLLILFSIYKFNSGEIRIYIFLGILLGLIFYLITLSKYFIKTNIKILNILKFLIGNIIIKPIKIINKFVNNILISPFGSVILKFRQKSTKKTSHFVKIRNIFKKKVANKKDFKI